MFGISASAAAKLAKECCVEFTKKDPSKPRFAAGLRPDKSAVGEPICGEPGVSRVL